MIVAFIDDHKHEHGVEPICRVLTTHGIPIAPSTYYAFRSRPAASDPDYTVDCEEPNIRSGCRVHPDSASTDRAKTRGSRRRGGLSTEMLDLAA